jgi:hypothetical protein
MAQPPTPAPPEIEREIRIEDIPVAETELEPPYRVLVHNLDVTNPIWGLWHSRRGCR